MAGVKNRFFAEIPRFPKRERSPIRNQQHTHKSGRKHSQGLPLERELQKNNIYPPIYSEPCGKIPYYPVQKSPFPAA
jgi:hypothetical protein